MPRAVERAQLAAQPQRIEIFEAERDDDEIVIAVGGVKQRLVRIGLDSTSCSACSAVAIRS